MKNAILAKVEETYQRAEQIFRRKFSRGEIKFDLTGATAGQARYSDGLLRFNLPLAEREGQAFINRTVPHECAHLFCFQIYGAAILGKPHGRQWTAIMNVLGCDASRCHSYDTTGIKQNRKKFKYACQCKIHEVGKLVHTRISVHGRKYTCRVCKTRLNEVFP